MYEQCLYHKKSLLPVDIVLVTLRDDKLDISIVDITSKVEDTTTNITINILICTWWYEIGIK